MTKFIFLIFAIVVFSNGSTAQSFPSFDEIKEMKKQATELKELSVEYYDHYYKLERMVSSTSLSGSPDQTISSLREMIDSYNNFMTVIWPTFNKPFKKLESKWKDDRSFSTHYRELYTKVEEDAHTAISDKVKQREFMSDFTNEYSSTPSSSIDFFQEQEQKLADIKSRIVEKGKDISKTNVYAANYQKTPKDVYDMLSGSKIILTTLQAFAPEDKSLASELNAVNQKEKEKIEMIRKARGTYKFPPRVADVPGNYLDIETAIAALIKKNDTRVGEVCKVRLAGDWKPVYNIFGVLVFYRISAFAAVKYKGDDFVSVDNLYVETVDAKKGTKFKAISIGGHAQMNSCSQ